MLEIHYALDSLGNYQVAPGDIELAQEHRLPEHFPPEQKDAVIALCVENTVQFVALSINLHKDVMP